MILVKVVAVIGKRDQVHVDNSDATIAMTSQMTYDAVWWVCVASVIQKSIFGTCKVAGEGPKRLAAKFALRMGFCWRHTTQGVFSKTRKETMRARKYAKRARRDGFDCWPLCRGPGLCSPHGLERRRPVGLAISENETSPLLVYRVSDRLAQWKYARWDFRFTQVGVRNTAQHHWKYEKPNPDGGLDDSDVEVEPTKIVWRVTAWPSTSGAHSVGGDLRSSTTDELAWSWSSWSWTE